MIPEQRSAWSKSSQKLLLQPSECKVCKGRLCAGLNLVYSCIAALVLNLGQCGHGVAYTLPPATQALLLRLLHCHLAYLTKTVS